MVGFMDCGNCGERHAPEFGCDRPPRVARTPDLKDKKSKKSGDPKPEKAAQISHPKS